MSLIWGRWGRGRRISVAMSMRNLWTLLLVKVLSLSHVMVLLWCLVLLCQVYILTVTWHLLLTLHVEILFCNPLPTSETRFDNVRIRETRWFSL